MVRASNAALAHRVRTPIVVIQMPYLVGFILILGIKVRQIPTEGFNLRLYPVQQTL